MKYIKLYEKIEKQKDINKLYNHLLDVFSKYYGYNVYKDDDGNKTIIFQDVNYDIMFTIVISTIDNRLLSISKDSDLGICSYILDYFKTIRGIHKVKESKNKLIFSILYDSIDNIIKQISNDDFDVKYKTSKYNL